MPNNIQTEIFSRISWLATHHDSSMPVRLLHMHETLVLICHEGVKDTNQSFGNLFAQVDFLCRKHSISVPDTIEIQTARRHSNGKEKNLDEVEILYDCRALAILTSAVLNCDIPADVVGKIPVKGRQKPKARHIDYRHIRCIVDTTLRKENGDSENAIIVRLESGEASRYVNISSAHEYILRIVKEGMMLSLTDVHEEDNDTLSPRFIIIEPDYLLDISRIAHCFTDYGHHPLAYFVNLMSPAPNSQAIILGNYAGAFLDDYMHGNASWDETLKRHFADDALAYATCPEFSPAEYKTMCQRQAKNIKDIIDEIKKQRKTRNSNQSLPGKGQEDVFLLEPSFVCPALGINGRVDLMSADMTFLVEQKSGKNFNVETLKKREHGAYQTEEHYVQLLLYFAVLHQNFNIPVSKLDIRLMYSRYPLPNGLLVVNYYQELLQEAILLRNRIVASAMTFAREGFTPQFLKALTPQTLNQNKQNGNFYNRYVLPKLTNLLLPLHKLSPLEEAYFCRMVTFLYREQAIGCIGASEGTTRGMADIWNMPYAEKVAQGQIITGTIKADGESDSVTDVTLLRSDNSEVCFRPSDIISLYAYDTGKEPDATTAIIFKGSIVSLTSEQVDIHLTNPAPLSAFVSSPSIAAPASPEAIATIPSVSPEAIATVPSASAEAIVPLPGGSTSGSSAPASPEGRSFAIEANYSSSGISSGLRALHMLMSAPKERRDLLLGQRHPAVDTSVTLTRSYHPSYDDVLLRAKQAKDYFLLVGPPGTGKTSMAMRFMVQEHLATNAVLATVPSASPEAIVPLPDGSPSGLSAPVKGSILLTSYTNRAIDEICDMLTDAGIDFLRIGNLYSCNPRFHDHLASRRFADIGNLRAIRQHIEEVSVVVATTSTLMAHQHILALKHFSLTIVDEASQILEPSIIGLLARLGKFILIGDHKQLPAVVQQTERDSMVTDPLLLDIGLTNCRNSLFERLINTASIPEAATVHSESPEEIVSLPDGSPSGLSTPADSSPSPCIGTLHFQGRMHPAIAAWPNSMFYREEALLPVPLPHQTELRLDYNEPSIDALDDKLKQHRMLFFDITKASPAEGFAPPSPASPEVFATVPSVSPEVIATVPSASAEAIVSLPDGSPSGSSALTFSDLDPKCNLAEARLCAQLVMRLRRQLGNSFDASKSIGIIVPYRNQISLIRKEIAALGSQLQGVGESLTIDTVERYQGSQRDIIIYAFTISHNYQMEFLTSNTFTVNGREGSYPVDRKLNVALTRARKQMIIIGNKALLSQNPLYRSMIEHCENVLCPPTRQ